MAVSTCWEQEATPYLTLGLSPPGEPWQISFQAVSDGQMEQKPLESWRRNPCYKVGKGTFVVRRGGSIRLNEEEDKISDGMVSCLNPIAIGKISNLNFLAKRRKLIRMTRGYDYDAVPNNAV